MNNTFEAGAPKKLVDLYNDHYEKQIKKGKSEIDARKYAIRMTQHAGWYKGKKGWRQFTPDLLDKVNIREAVRQPDGRYVIEDVEVFYPNAVKGSNAAYSADDIRQIIKNTNRSIGSGSQKPSILEGHPHPEQAISGIQPDSHGFAVNWREHKNKPGWAVCDLIDVPEDKVNRLKNRNLTGLSAAFAKDAGGINKRFGHVALLGGATQALSSLPTHDIFTASTNYLCFSADADSFINLKGKQMKKVMNEKQKSCFTTFCTAKEAYDAAEKGLSMGEPEADKKVEEAYSSMQKAAHEFAGMFDPADPGNSTVSGGAAAPAEVPATGEPDTVVPEAPAQYAVGGEGTAPEVQPPNELTKPSSSFADDPEAAFNAAMSDISHIKTGLSEVVNAIKILGTKNSSLLGRMEKQNFDSTVIELRREGRQLPTNLDEQFSACLETRDPSKAVATLLNGLRSLPKGQTPATTTTQFAAAGNVAVAGKATDKASKTASEFRNAMGKLNISKEDMAFAALGEVFDTDAK